MRVALGQGFNLRRIATRARGHSLDETVTRAELTRLATLLSAPFPLSGVSDRAARPEKVQWV